MVFDDSVAGVVGMPYRDCKHAGVITFAQEASMEEESLAVLPFDADAGAGTTGSFDFVIGNLKRMCRCAREHATSETVIKRTSLSDTPRSHVLAVPVEQNRIVSGRSVARYSHV